MGKSGYPTSARHRPTDPAHRRPEEERSTDEGRAADDLRRVIKAIVKYLTPSRICRPRRPVRTGPQDYDVRPFKTQIVKIDPPLPCPGPQIRFRAHKGAKGRCSAAWGGWALNFRRALHPSQCSRFQRPPLPPSDRVVGRRGPRLRRGGARRAGMLPATPGV